MASKFVVFVAFAAVAQASLAAANVQSYQKETLSQWDDAADILFSALANPKSNFDTVESQYLNAGHQGALAFAKAALGEKQTAVGKEPSARLKEVAKDVVAALKAAATATSKNIDQVNQEIDSEMQKVPVKEGVNGYFTIAKSKASQNDAIAHLTAVYQKYAAAFKAQAAKQSGKSKSVDLKSFKDAAYANIANFVGDIFNLLPKKD